MLAENPKVARLRNWIGRRLWHFVFVDLAQDHRIKFLGIESGCLKEFLVFHLQGRQRLR